MKIYLIAIAVVYLAISAAHAADPRALIPPNRFGATHALVPFAVSPQRSASDAPSTAPAPEAAAFNTHIALWRSFDVAAGVCGSQPAAINDLGEITGTYFDSNCNSHGFLRKAWGEIVTFDAPNAGYPSSIQYPGTTPTDINNEGDIVGSFTDAAGGTHGVRALASQGRSRSSMITSSTSSPPATFAQAINDWGFVVGFWYDLNGNSHGFVRQVDGTLIAFEPAGALYSQGYHINDLGCRWADDWTDAAHWNLRMGCSCTRNGKLVTFDAPNAGTHFRGPWPGAQS